MPLSFKPMPLFFLAYCRPDRFGYGIEFGSWSRACMKKRRNAIKYCGVEHYFIICGATKSFYSLFVFLSSFIFISTEYSDEHYQPFYSVSIYITFSSLQLQPKRSELNKSIRTTSIFFKQSLPRTHKSKSQVHLSRITFRSYASSSMTSPTIKLNSGHQMPIVGFGRVATF